jgi:hypothetical protein
MISIGIIPVLKCSYTVTKPGGGGYGRHISLSSREGGKNSSEDGSQVELKGRPVFLYLNRPIGAAGESLGWTNL